MKEGTREYLKGFKEGFEAALKMAWAHAEELHINVDNSAKDAVRKYIEKLSS